MTSFLEVGCGTGHVLAGVRDAFPSARLSGGDLYPEGLGYAAERVPEADIRELDVLRLPFDSEFDVAGAFDVLEHIDDDLGALRGLRDAVRAGGGVIATVPQHPWLWSERDDLAHHRRRYTRRELVGKAERSGLEPVFVTSFVTLPLPALAAQRLLGRGRPVSNEQAAKALVPPRPLTLALDAALGLERAVIRAGISLPAGGSLLLIARRPS